METAGVRNCATTFPRRVIAPRCLSIDLELGVRAAGHNVMVVAEAATGAIDDNVIALP